MAITAENKKSILQSFQKHEKDTGSSEVQIALLTERISGLTTHLKLHKKDAHSRRWFIIFANLRRALLDYLKGHDFEKYQDTVARLGLRH